MENEEILRLVRLGTWEMDFKTNTMYWSDITREIHEVTSDFQPSMETGINFYKEGESRELIRKVVKAAIENGERFEVELELVTAKKRDIWVVAKGMPEFENGVCVRLYGTFREITENKKSLLDLAWKYQLNQIIVSQSPYAVAMFDTKMCYISTSEKWFTDYGLEKTDLIGKSHYDIFPETPDIWKSIHQASLKGETNVQKEVLFVRKDGRQQWLNWDIRPWYINDNEIGGLLVYTEDVTEKVNMRNKLEISEDQFEGAFEHSTIGMAIVSPDGKWLKVNSKLCEIVGYPEEELVQMRFQDITHPDDLHNDTGKLKEMLDFQIESYRVEKRYIHKNGQFVWVQLSVSLVWDENDEPLHFVSQIQDITKWKEAQISLLKMNSELNAILDSTYVAIIASGIDGTIQHFNRGAEMLLGYASDELIHKESSLIFHEERELKKRSTELSRLYGRQVEGFELLTMIPRSGQPDSREWTYVHRSGEKIPVHVVVTAIRNVHGEIEGYLQVANDLSERKKAEKELTEVSERLSLATEAARIGIWEYDLVNNSVFWDDVMFELYDIKREDFKGDYTSWQHILHPEDLETCEKELREAIDGGADYDTEFRIIRSDGSVHYIRAVAIIQYNDLGKAVKMVGCNWDITPQRKEGEMIKNILETAPDAMVIVDSNGRIEMINSQTERLFGYSKSDILGDTVERLIPGNFRNNHSSHRSDFFRQSKTRNMGSGMELFAIRKDGTEFPVEISLGPLETEDGLLVSAAIRDITERKKAEKELLTMRALEAKNKEMEQFAYVASHDLQEPLITMTNYIRLLVEEYGDRFNGNGRRYTRVITKAAHRMEQLITGLLDYSRLGRTQHYEAVDCNKILENVVADLEALIKLNDARVNWKKLPVIQGYPLELKLLMQNLVANAVKFRHPMRQPIVNVTAKKITDGWEFSIEDNGIGIEKNNQKRIFEIFKKLHSRHIYEGTGIGLAHAKKITEIHGGDIWVNSEPGKGSNFHFTILTESV